MCSRLSVLWLIGETGPKRIDSSGTFIVTRVGEECEVAHVCHSLQTLLAGLYELLKTGMVA